MSPEPTSATPQPSRAVRFDRYGGRDVLHVDTVPRPVPGPGQVLVTVRAAGINPGEAAIREGELDSFAPSTFPSGQGSDLAGVVEQLGPDVEAFAVGDAVLGWSWNRDTHATHVVVPVAQLIPKPARLPWEVAGALYVVGATAVAAVRAVSARPGETVVVSAAAGGVGALVTQLLVADGVRVVGIASSANADWLRAHGAVPVPYGDGLEDRVRAAAPDGVDALIDLHGPEYVDLGVALGVPPGRIDTIISFARAAEVGARTDGSVAGTGREVMQQVVDRVLDGRLLVEVTRTYPLDHVADAFAALEKGHGRGKIVLTPTPGLWEPVTVGRMRLTHRLALSPMTRSRAGADGVPGPWAADYYRQRASLGLLVTEGTQPSADGQGYLATPGLHTDAQQEGWREVVDAVHDAGAHLVVQLMHVGRMAHPDNTPHHRRPVAPSAVAPGVDLHTASGPRPVPVPRALATDEVPQIVEQFVAAARRAVDAGADGVELHAANGYLLHQFLAPNANLRVDDWGGSLENRARLTVEPARAAAAEIGSDRTGVRLSPGSHAGGLDEGPEGPDLYRYLVRELDALDLMYLHLFSFADESLLQELRRAWSGPLLLVRAGRRRDRLGGDLADDVASGTADLVPVGSAALANPDLVARLRTGVVLNEADPSTYYGGGAHGYTDYPTLDRLGA